MGRVPHEGRESADLTHRVLSRGLNQSSVSALEAAEAPPGPVAPSSNYSFLDMFPVWELAGSLGGATDNEQLDVEPPSMGH